MNHGLGSGSVQMIEKAFPLGALENAGEPSRRVWIRVCRFRGTKTFDLLAAAPLILLYAFALAGLVLRFSKESPGLALLPWNATLLLDVMLDAVTALYIGMTVYVVIVRKIPVAKSHGAGPRSIAVIASNLQMSLLVLPRATIPATLAVISLSLATIGTASEIVILVWLRLSFSIFPEARKLVTAGPYRWVRHPIYLMGTISSLGLCLQFAQPWAFLITLVTFGFQLWRMGCEEAVLARAFPEYADYAQRTARLIPKVY